MAYALSVSALVPLAGAAWALLGRRLPAREAARNRQPMLNLLFSRLRTAWGTMAGRLLVPAPRQAGREARIALEGMPPRAIRGTISTAGRLPTLLFYLPVLLHCLRLALRHGSFMLPSVANPQILCGGFRGESDRKSTRLNSSHS